MFFHHVFTTLVNGLTTSSGDGRRPILAGHISSTRPRFTADHRRRLSDLTMIHVDTRWYFILLQYGDGLVLALQTGLS